MSIYGKFVKHVTYPLLAPYDGWEEVKKKLKEYGKSQYLDPEKLRDYQLSRVKTMLVHAHQNVPFYRKRFKDAGFVPEQFKSFSELRVLPALTKSDLQKYLSTLTAENFSEKEIHKDATGGSTGSHTPFYRDNNCLGVKKAIEFRCNQWTGWDVGEKMAYYWPAIQDFSKKKSWKGKVKNQFMYRSLMLYSGKQNEEILEGHYRELFRFQPTLLRTFPNPLSILAQYIKTTGKPTFRIPSIISVGEPLLESHRKLFSEVFGAKVYNCYVSRECGNMACECGMSSGSLHVNAEMVYIEPLDVSTGSYQKPVKFLVTDLTNFGMPFIRYQIEDLGIFTGDACRCGRGLPMLKMDAGRASDFLISPHDKSRISGCSLLHHLVAEGPEVGQIQIIQDQINHMTFRIVRSQGFKQDNLAHFDQVIEKIFKGTMQFDVEYVTEIKREKSQKYFFTKCLISEKDYL